MCLWSFFDHVDSRSFYLSSQIDSRVTSSTCLPSPTPKDAERKFTVFHFTPVLCGEIRLRKVMSEWGWFGFKCHHSDHEVSLCNIQFHKLWPIILCLLITKCNMCKGRSKDRGLFLRAENFDDTLKMFSLKIKTSWKSSYLRSCLLQPKTQLETHLPTYTHTHTLTCLCI